VVFKAFPFWSPDQFMKNPILLCTMAIATSMLTNMPKAATARTIRKSAPGRQQTRPRSPKTPRAREYASCEELHCSRETGSAEPAEYLLSSVHKKDDTDHKADKRNQWVIGGFKEFTEHAMSVTGSMFPRNQPRHQVV